MARSALFPKISVNASFTRLSGDRLSFSSMPSKLYEQEEYAGISARQFLFDAGKKTHATEATSKALEAMALEKTDLLDETVRLVTKAFLSVLETKHLLTVAQNAVARQKHFEAMTQTFFDAGKVTKLDVMKARAQRIQADNDLNKAQHAVRLATTFLKQAIGIYGERQIDITGELPKTVAPTPDFISLFTQAKEQNFTIKRLAVMVSKQTEEIASAQGAFWPEVEMQATYGVRDRDIGGSADEWTAGIVANWSLFDSGFNKANKARATAKHQEAIHQLETAKLKLYADLEKEIVQWQVAYADFETAANLIKANQEALETAQALYAAGKAVALDVLTAQLELSKAEQDMVSALYKFSEAKTNIDRLTGNNGLKELKYQDEAAK